jgi:MFS family permease
MVEPHAANRASGRIRAGVSRLNADCGRSPEIAIMTENTAPSPPDRGFAAFVALMAGLMMLGALGLDGMLPSLPIIVRDLDIRSPNDSQLVLVVYGLSIGLGTIVYGPLMDRYGRKPVLLAGLVGFVLSSALAAVATSLTMLLVARAIQGVAIASARIGALSVIRDRYPRPRMAQAMSISMLVFMAGNFGALAMEPTGHIAGSAASTQGLITMVAGAFVGFAIGQAFDGTVVPLVIGTLLCGLATLAVVALAERGWLFQPGREAKAAGPELLLQGGGT